MAASASSSVRKLADDLGELVEQPLVAAIVGEGRQQFGGQRRDFTLSSWSSMRSADEVAQAGALDRRKRLRHQPRDEARQRIRALRIGQPVGDERRKIDFVQLLAHRPGRQEIDLDEAAEIVGDAVLVGGNDGGVRNGQAERPLEQRHHRIPVGEAADGGGLGEGGHEAEPRASAAAETLAVAKTATQRHSAPWR